MALTYLQRKRRLYLTGAAGLALAGLVVVLVNVLGNWVFARIDLTRQKAYSLSDSSKKLVRGLGDPVIVKAYFTPDLPAPYNLYERYARDLLAEYRSASRGRLRYEFILPNPPAEFEKKAAEAGLMPIQFEQVGSDQFQVRRGFMGLVLYHRDKTESIPIVKNVQQLEYDLTSRIAKMAERKKKSVAIVSGHGETEWQNANTKLAADMAELYALEPALLSASTTEPIRADALLVVGPKQKYDEKALWAIDQAIMRGIPTAFMLDIKNFIPGRFFVMEQETGLRELLRHYGFVLGDRLIYDAQCETIGVTQNMAGFAFTTSLRYPYIPLVDRILNTHPIGRGLDTVGLPFVTSVEPAQGLPPTVHFSPLLYTSPKSWFAPARPSGSVAPNEIPRPGPDEPHGPFSVAGVIEGTFVSYFQGKPIPVAQAPLIGSSPKTQVVVLGSARMLDPQMPAFPGSEGLLSNLLAYLTRDETLVGIRTKGDIIRPLKPVSRPEREAVKYGTVLGVAALPMVMGLWQWRRRRAWKVSIAGRFAPKTPARD